MPTKPKPTHELSPVAQAARYRNVIDHVEEAIARHDAVAVQAVEVQRGAAFEAASGDQDARRILAEAAAAEAQARTEARSLGMALEEACKRLAEAEAEAEVGRERSADLERRAVEAARVRVEAARKVDAAVAELAEAFATFEAAGHSVRVLQGEPGADRVLAGIDFRLARNLLLDAIPHGLREPLRLPFATGEVRPKVADADPVAGWLASREGGGTDPRMAKLAADVEAQEARTLELSAGGLGSRRRAEARLARVYGGTPSEAMVQAEMARAAALLPRIAARLATAGGGRPTPPPEAFVLAETERELEASLAPHRAAGGTPVPAAGGPWAATEARIAADLAEADERARAQDAARAAA